jgi:hypothetical protein
VTGENTGNTGAQVTALDRYRHFNFTRNVAHVRRDLTDFELGVTCLPFPC